MMRPRLALSGSFTVLSLLASCLAACSSDAPPQSGGLAGAPASNGGAPASAGSPSGGSGNAGSANGSSGAPGASGSAQAGAAQAGASQAGTGAGGAAQAGAGGAGTAGSGTAGSGSAGAPANAILSADFESDLVGKQPTGWHNFLAYNIDATNPQKDAGNAKNDLQAIVDDTRPHGGKNSLHIKSPGGPAFLTMPLPANTKKLYVRGYFYMTRQLGQNPGANHETLLGIRKDKDHEIRFGEIKGVLGVNEVPSDNITPKMDLWGKGPLIAANKWVCIEASFIGDQAQNEVHGWADGTEVITATKGDQWQNGTEPANWLDGYWNEFMIGWQSFSSASNEIWVDDLVLAPNRINCQ